MLYKNALVFTGRDGFVPGGFTVENGRFGRVFAGEAPVGGEDLGGRKVIPGLVDMHIHGAAGADMADCDSEGLRRMGRLLARRGVTSFVPTAAALPEEKLAAAMECAAKTAGKEGTGCAKIAGLRMEGPYLAPEKKGAQNGDYLRAPDINEFETLYRLSGGLLRVADAAPELPGAAAFAGTAGKKCLVSAGHTQADYETAAAFFDAGGRHLTHLFNAMGPIGHRSPGVIGAASERPNVTAELICDGLHVHPSAVRMAFRLFPGRLCLVSDALRCCGMADGTYELAGLEVRLYNGEARLADGTLAGSVTDLFTCMRRAVSFGVPEEEAIRAASCRPAEALGLRETMGDIAPGLAADFVICGEDLRPERVFIDGAEI